MTLNEIADRLEKVANGPMQRSTDTYWEPRSEVVRLVAELRAMQPEPVNKHDTFCDLLRTGKCDCKPHTDSTTFPTVAHEAEPRCSDCPPPDYPTDKTRCKTCPLRTVPGIRITEDEEAEPPIYSQPGYDPDSSRRDFERAIYASTEAQEAAYDDLHQRPTEAAPERIWRVVDPENGIPLGEYSEAIVRMLAKQQPWSYVAQFSDDSGATWQNVPEGKAEAER